ncbi:MAG: Fur family transcriptional regulator [Firmicutes bacterium ML8_F2]|jgi:Fur family transcriptional regulator, peroxide stress response regulator|nr:MAG: Fur family transcriptional regulator [Firmicutes bacterium ML8_F2]
MNRYKYKRSKQRDKIFNILQNTDTHPTASWIYDELKKEFNNLSMGTVYRNLNILIDQHLIKKIESGNSFDRFDGNTEPHYHFICRKCGSVYDIPIDLIENLDQKASLASGFQVETHEIKFSGICKYCLENSKKQEA